MQFNIKRTVGIAYIIAGFVWCILNLPNLMARAKGNAIFATGLSIIRILFWPFFIMLLEMFAMMILSSITIIFTINSRSIQKSPSNKKIIAVLILLPVLISLFLLPPITIEIQPNNKPEVVFWTGAFGIPDDSETLIKCAENDIAFAVVLRKEYLTDDDGMSEYIEIIESSFKSYN